MNDKALVKYTLDSLIRAGASKGRVHLQKEKHHELAGGIDRINLFKTTLHAGLNLKAILQNRESTLTINELQEKSINGAVKKVIEMAKCSRPSDANDISPDQPPGIFKSGPREYNFDLVYGKLENFQQYVREKYQDTFLSELKLTFVKKENYFLNSNGVDFISTRGMYDFFTGFTTKKGQKNSHLNYASFLAKDLEKEIKDFNTIDILLKESERQTMAKVFPGKVVGDVIITPDSTGHFYYPVLEQLKDYAILNKTSLYRDKLDKMIASPKFSMHSTPLAGEITGGDHFTDDGFKTENTTIIQNGVLKRFMLSLYGSKKTGLDKPFTGGNNMCIDPGDKSYRQMIESVKCGVIIDRFVCRPPAKNGDFSGVGKNLYYIEAGEIKYPLGETIISGNLAGLLLDIKEISRERVNFGYTVRPWILVSGLTISGTRR